MLKRRNLLMSAAAWSLIAPVLRASRATAAGAPRRLILFGTPNGLNPFSAAGLSPEMKKLAGDILLLDGISMKAADDAVVPGIDDHIKGPPVMFTAHIKGKDLEGGRSSGKPLGPSLDQFVANKLASPTRLPSLELGVSANSAVNFGMNLGSLPFENSPPSALGRVVAGATPGGGGTTVAPGTMAPVMDALRVRRKSVLDHLTAEISGLKPRLASDERAKLDGHLDALRALEKRLLPPAPTSNTPPPQQGPACAPKTVSTGVSGFPAIGRAQMDVLAMAFACDATRVGTIRWGGRTHNLSHPWAGVGKGHHDVVHSDDVAAQVKILHWYGDQFAYLLGKLKSMADVGGGTVLDNTVVVWNSDMATGGHGWTNGCMVVGGGKALGMKVGRVVKNNGATQNDLFLAVLRALGIEVNTFGNPAFCRGPLADAI